MCIALIELDGTRASYSSGTEPRSRVYRTITDVCVISRIFLFNGKTCAVPTAMPTTLDVLRGGGGRSTAVYIYLNEEKGTYRT